MFRDRFSCYPAFKAQLKFISSLGSLFRRFSCYPAFKAQLKFISSLGSLFRMFQAPLFPRNPRAQLYLLHSQAGSRT